MRGEYWTVLHRGQETPQRLPQVGDMTRQFSSCGHQHKTKGAAEKCEERRAPWYVEHDIVSAIGLRIMTTTESRRRAALNPIKRYVLHQREAGGLPPCVPGAQEILNALALADSHPPPPPRTRTCGARGGNRRTT